MIPLRSITSRTITAPASLVRRSTRASMTTPALKLGWKVDGVSPMGCSALADIAAHMPESATHLAQEPAQSAVSMNREGALKLAGAAYLLWIGLRTIRSARREVAVTPDGLAAVASIGPQRAFREGVLVEALNPKTAAFILAFVPQFIDPAAGQVALQFAVLGTVSVV